MAGTSGEYLDRNVSRETRERFDLLEALVGKWNPAINLVSAGSLAHFQERHIADSMQIYGLAADSTGIWCDLGSGGGFPGLVVAILAQEDGNRFKVKLVEADGRKSAFLREAARQIGLEVIVYTSRIEDLPPVFADILSARALTSLPKLCEFAMRHLNPSGRALFPKGARYNEEVSAARERWQFDLVAHPSKTDPAAAVLEMRNIRHV
jgi:16S rRNA (guanine527-N7)-methyltransferase